VIGYDLGYKKYGNGNILRKDIRVTIRPSHICELAFAEKVIGYDWGYKKYGNDKFCPKKLAYIPYLVLTAPAKQQAGVCWLTRIQRG
jgi:hypothetical protein